MRTYELLTKIEGFADDIKLVLEYLALSEKHFVTITTKDPCNNPILTTQYHMNDRGGIYCTSDLLDEIAKVNLNLGELQTIVKEAKLSQPTEDYRDTFDNKWEEIKGITEINMGANKLTKR